MARSYTPDELAAAEGLLLLWASRSVTVTPRDVQGAVSNNPGVDSHEDTEHSHQHDDMQTSRSHDVDMLPPSPPPESASSSSRTATQNSIPGLRANIPPFHEEGSPQYAHDQEQRQITRLMILRHVMNNRPPGRAEIARQNIMQRFPPRGSRLDREQTSRLGRIPGAARDGANRLPPRFLPARNPRPADSRPVASGGRNPGHNGSAQHDVQTNTAPHDASGRTVNSTTDVNGSAAVTSHREQSTADSQPGMSLQKYLIRQQMIAGVQPEEIAPIRPQAMVNNPSAPVVLQIRNDAVAVPRIPPAQFSGPLQPLRIVPRGGSGSVNGPVTRDTALHSHPLNQGPEPKSDNDKSAAANNEPQPLPLPQTPQRPAGSRYLTRSVTRRTRDQNSLDTSTPGPQAPASAVVKSEGDTNPAAHPPRLEPNISAPDSNNTNKTNLLWAQEQTTEEAPRHPSALTITIPHNNFDLLAALSAHPELTVMITDLLHPEDILTLLTTSRPLHQTLHHNLPTITTHHLHHLNTTTHPPNISDTFPLICYPRLYTQPSTPKITYLLMLTSRTTTINRIVTTLQVANIFLPAGTALVLRKIWFLMDVPDNHRREWTVRNRNLWSDLDLFLGVFLMVQVDAFLAEVKGVKRSTVMRQLCFAQRSLVGLADYLWGKVWGDEMGAEVERALGRWKGIRAGSGGGGGGDGSTVAAAAAPAATAKEEGDGAVVDGVTGPAIPSDPEPTRPTNANTTAATAATTSNPTEEEPVALQYEYYGRKNTSNKIKLLRPDEWIMREILHRGLDLQKMYKLVFGEGRREQFETPGVAGQRVTWDEQMRMATLRSQVDWMEVVRLDL
ncbi:hypothetical protein ASPACDRAFT_1891696 [Aspergillus aculeatus ATCC 16872]|uniref:Uncharacterized protein n=1 Tax=Aspergillus aculeatus (strain ATCC 16872 / CBS 172.66 / WB 5094) TaxID=690307 RepID=A0A1L9WH07_ASPA1|nr:uncharacterized protein ASPACDRAFT_1891696 [Aspergillus aculeatus ATCC 16872]OJJ95446.1 hypothetical protein ASPACDRAFT_1891696 [Aspergillus aculeatus ATCC 16872]